MPKRNSPSNVVGVTDTTMNYEYIVILKKRGNKGLGTSAGETKMKKANVGARFISPEKNYNEDYFSGANLFRTTSNAINYLFSSNI